MHILKWFTAPLRKARIKRKILSRCDKYPIYSATGDKYIQRLDFRYTPKYDIYTRAKSRAFGIYIYLDLGCGFISYTVYLIHRNGTVEHN